MTMVIKRIIALVLTIILSPIFFLIGFIIIIDDGWSVFYKQQRIGKNNQIFHIYKFRTMQKNTPEIASHLLDGTDKYFTKSGVFLRKMSLDELPQLFNIIFGEMTFVGPRPALHNQTDLIELRNQYGIHNLIPGVTGWAQINGRDELKIQEKVKFDAYYLAHKSILLDLKIIFITIVKVLKRSGVAH